MFESFHLKDFVERRRGLLYIRVNTRALPSDEYITSEVHFFLPDPSEHKSPVSHSIQAE